MMILSIALLLTSRALAQSAEYSAKKAAALTEKSVFEKIVDRELPATILFEDKEIMAFIPLRKQAPVHILIIPKKRIVSVNEIKDGYAELVGNMFIVARNLANEYKIDVQVTGLYLILMKTRDKVFFTYTCT
jgi:histidine triad (HIT) family protein